jgi:hypothetical protein
VTVLIHIANVLYLASYLVKDILWLRALTVVAGLTLIPYFALRPEPLWAPVAWNVVFTAINVYQIYVLFLERRPVRLTEDEEHLHRLCFRALTPREFKKLIAVGRWESANEGEAIVRKGEDLERMMVIFSGSAAVRAGERHLADLKPGHFVGEMTFLSGQRPTVDVVAVGGLRLVSWSIAPLRTLLEKHRPIHGALQMILGSDLVTKLRAA